MQPPTDPAASSKTSSSDEAAEVLNLMRKWLHGVGVPTAHLSSDELRAEYARTVKRRDEESNAAAERREAERCRRLEEQRVAGLRERVRNLGADPTGMSVDQLLARVDQARQEKERERGKEAARKQEEWNRQRAEILFHRSQCPKRHVLNMDKIDATKCPEWAKVRDMLTARVPGGFLIALLGARGPGKTQMGVSLIHRTCETLRSARYVKAATLFQEIKRAYAPRARGESGETEADIIEQFVGYDLLVIDELHQRAETDWEQNMLVHILDRRYDDMKATLIIANQTKDEFSAAMGPSIVSRIHETGTAIECTWSSFRKPGMWHEDNGGQDAGERAA